MPKANDTDIYKFNEYPSLLDYLFGTDASDFKKNKSYRLNSIIQLINGVNGKNNMQFIFSDGSNVDATYYNKGFFFTDTNEGNPTGFTKLILNKESLQPINLTELFTLLSTLENVVLKIENPTDPNNFFNFRITNIADEDGFFVFDILVFNGFVLGNLINEAIYSFYFDIKTVTESGGVSDPLKLDKSTYAGNAQDLDTRIDALENTTLPDMVLKYGEVVVNGTTASIVANSFQWRLNQISFLTTPTFSTPIDTATAGYYRSDLIVGDNMGNFSLIKGNEDNLTAPEPLVPVGKIKLALIPIFGATIGMPPVLPNFDDKFLKRYKTTYKTVQPIFNLDPAEDDYNVIFNNTTDSEIRIYENGHSGRPLIKNGAIYPFKSRGTGNVTVVNAGTGVTVNAPNGLILPKNVQCYLIKDDYNEWTVIIPVTKIDLDLKADKNFLFIQGTPSALWIINHNLAKFPSVTVIDSAGTTVEGAVNYIDLNNLTITFSASFSGSATIN